MKLKSYFFSFSPRQQFLTHVVSCLPWPVCVHLVIPSPISFEKFLYNICYLSATPQKKELCYPLITPSNLLIKESQDEEINESCVISQHQPRRRWLRDTNTPSRNSSKTHPKDEVEEEKSPFHARTDIRIVPPPRHFGPWVSRRSFFSTISLLCLHGSTHFPTSLSTDFQLQFRAVVHRDGERENAHFQHPFYSSFMPSRGPYGYLYIYLTAMKRK